MRPDEVTVAVPSPRSSVAHTSSARPSAPSAAPSASLGSGGGPPSESVSTPEPNPPVFGGGGSRTRIGSPNGTGPSRTSAITSSPIVFCHAITAAPPDRSAIVWLFADASNGIVRGPKSPPGGRSYTSRPS